jgi:hypothetical protein
MDQTLPKYEENYVPIVSVAPPQMLGTDHILDKLRRTWEAQDTQMQREVDGRCQAIRDDLDREIKVLQEDAEMRIAGVQSTARMVAQERQRERQLRIDALLDTSAPEPVAASVLWQWLSGISFR